MTDAVIAAPAEICLERKAQSGGNRAAPPVIAASDRIISTSPPTCGMMSATDTMIAPKTQVETRATIIDERSVASRRIRFCSMSRVNTAESMLRIVLAALDEDDSIAASINPTSPVGNTMRAMRMNASSTCSPARFGFTVRYSIAGRKNSTGLKMYNTPNSAATFRADRSSGTLV